MKKIKLRKLAAMENPFAPTADFKTYKLGQANQKSLPIEYTLEGFLIKKIKVGEQIVIQRTKRNDVELPGIFMSS